MRIAIKALFFALVLALWATLPSIDAYDFSGDTVYIDDANVFLAAYPHTFSMKDCEFSEAKYPVCTAYFMLKTKVGGAGFPISAYWGFNTEAAVPIRAEIYNGTEWKPWKTDFSKIEQNYDGKNRWYNVNATVDEGIEYLVRVYIRVKDPGYAKYDFAIKPRDETFQESVAAGRFYLLDPWYNLSYLYRRAITAGNAAILNPVTLPIAVNSTVFYPNTTYYQVAWCNFTVTNMSGTVGWLYYSNQTSYECINSTHTGSTDFMDIDEGNRSGFGNWGPNTHVVLHMNGTNTTDQSIYKRLTQKFGNVAAVAGKIGGGIDFDGNGDYYNVTAIDPPLVDSDRSLVAWINPDVCASEDYIFYFGKYSAQKLWGVSVGTNCILEVFGYDPDAYSVARVTIGIWTFVAITYNSSASQLTFFVNGTRELETPFVKNYATESTGNYSVGCGTGTTTGCFNGKLDEVRFYNRTLSDDEVYAMYYGSSLGTEDAGYPNVTITSPANITYTNADIAVTWGFSSTKNYTCNWSAYSLDGAANVSTSCINTSITVGEGGHNITIWANDSTAAVGKAVQYFAYEPSFYSVAIYDEMTKKLMDIDFSAGNATLFFYCSNMTQNISLVNVSTFTILPACNFTNAELVLNFSGYYQRRTLIPASSIYSFRFYMVNWTTSAIFYQRWAIVDYSGKWKRIQLDKYYGDGVETIIKQEIGTLGFLYLYLIPNERYCVTLLDEDESETSSVWGSTAMSRGCQVIDSSESEAVLQLGFQSLMPSVDLTFNMVAMHFYWNSSSGTVYGLYNDTLNLTDSVSFSIYNATVPDELLFTESSTDSYKIFSRTGLDTNQSYILTIGAYHRRYGVINETHMVIFAGEAMKPDLEGAAPGYGKYVSVAGGLLFIIVLLSFPPRHSHVGFLVALLVFGMLMAWNWFSSAGQLEWGAFVLVVIAAVLGIIVKGVRNNERA